QLGQPPLIPPGVHAENMRSEGPGQLRLTWWPGLVWLIGTVFVWGRSILSRLLLFVIGCRSRLSADGRLSERARFLAGLLRIRRRVRLIEMQRLTGPVAFG